MCTLHCKTLSIQNTLLLRCYSQRPASECEPCTCSHGATLGVGTDCRRRSNGRSDSPQGHPMLLAEAQHGGPGKHFMLPAQRVSGVHR